jgi:phosphoglycerol transferase
MKKKIFSGFGFLILFIIISVGFSARWLVSHFGSLKMEDILFTAKAQLDGVEKGIIVSYIEFSLIPSLLLFITFVIVATLLPRISLIVRSREIRIGLKQLFIIGIVAFSFQNLFMVAKSVELKEFVKNQADSTTIYEEYYVDPREVALVFPKEKLNVIYIILESMETTFASKKTGGAYDYNMIPRLTDLAINNVSFSTTDQINGQSGADDTAHYTSASLVAQHSGVPLNVAVFDNPNYGEYLPGAYSLGEILEKEGYTQEFLIGSIASYGGRDRYFSAHGNYIIHDYAYAINNGLIPKDYWVWWGYEDKKLFQFAKDDLTKLASSSQPFNLTLLTVDTHNVGGYKCDLCGDAYPDQFSNIVACADSQVNDFINWVKQQDFYEDTVIVITGDHISKEPDYFNNIPNDYVRGTYNALINAQPIYDEYEMKNRSFYAMDWFPTVLGAMGVRIDGNRLGLGTNLFSDMPTIMEEAGTLYIRGELVKSSEFYNNNILFDD